MRLGILGGGRAAWAFGTAWRGAGEPLSGVWLRSESASRLPELLETRRLDPAALAETSDLLLIAVTDRAIAEVADLIPPAKAIVFHASGSLRAVRGGFSLHPLRALPPAGEPCDLRGTPLIFEGAHRETAQRVAATAGGRFIEISGDDKPLYHAAAVFGANYVAASLDIANVLMNQAGLENVREDLAELARSAIENWLRNEGAARFTGPAARGDRDIVEGHLRSLEGDTDIARIYELLADHIARSVAAAK